MKPAATRKPSAARAAAALAVVLCALALALGTAWAADDDSDGSLAALAASDDEAEDAAGGGWTELTDELVIENAGTLSAGNYYLSEDVTLTTYNVTLSGETTLDLKGHTLTDSGADTSVITVSSNASLTLVDSGSEGSGTITGGSTTNGGGVYVEGGAFTMEGGTITGCSTTNGGGVYVASSGTFTMNGGSISKNTASASGGGVRVLSGTFTMTGGSISNNTAGAGGGVAVRSGSFTMSGGVISGNADTNSSGGGGGLRLWGADFSMSGGAISNNTCNNCGGAICSMESSTISMTGGTISGNSAVTGGGVYSRATDFTMSGGTISGNSATNGGGVYVCVENFTNSTNSTFAMSGGTISGNSATNGGGVYVNQSNNSKYITTFALSGGTISGNTSSSYGGGVYVYNSSTAKLFVSSSSVAITSNTDSGSYNSDDIYIGSGAARSITAIAGEWYGGTSSTSTDSITMTSLSSSTTYYLYSSLAGATVTYVANAEDAAGSSFTQYVASTSSLADGTVFYREGYHISGWNTAADGSGTGYEAGASAASIASAGSDVTLYAQWEADACAVAFADGAGGLAFDGYAVDVSYGDATPGYDADGDGAEDEPEPEGLVFQGWSATVDGASYYEVPATVEGDVVLTASWKKAVPEFDAQTVVYDGGAQGFDLGNEAGLDEDSFEVAYYEDEACTQEVVDSDGNATSPTDAGTYYVKISREADGTYAAFEQTAVLTVEKAAPTVTVAGATATYDGSAHAAEATVAGVDGQAASSLDGVSVTVTYTDEEGNAVDEPTAVGSYTATATYAGSANYGAATATATVVIYEEASAPFKVESDNSALDGESHGVLVTPASEDATVTYSTDGVNFSEDPPGFTGAGVHTVYFRIEEPGCATVEGSATVTIVG